MKKAILKVLLLICGLNVFTACYGPCVSDWDPVPLPEEQDQTEVSVQDSEDPVEEEDTEMENAE